LRFAALATAKGETSRKRMRKRDLLLGPKEVRNMLTAMQVKRILRLQAAANFCDDDQLLCSSFRQTRNIGL
jgi:hypothetical protein